MDIIIDVLVRQVGRPLGERLILLMCQTLRPLSRWVRAELVAVTDDTSEVEAILRLPAGKPAGC